MILYFSATGNSEYVAKYIAHLNDDETVDMIFERLNWDPKTHTMKKTKFNPEKSIYNTQLYLKNPEYKAECDIIAKELSEYIYDFPYEIKHINGEVF